MILNPQVTIAMFDPHLLGGLPLQASVSKKLFSVLVNGLIFGSIFALTAVGLTLVFGILDVPNFAQGEFASLAGYGTIVLVGATGIGLVPSIVIAVAVTFVAGMAMERVVIAPLYGDDDFLLKTFFISFGVLIGFEQLLRQWFGSDFYQIHAPDFGLWHVFGTPLTGMHFVVSLAAIGLIYGLYLFTHRTRLGLAMRAVSDDREGALVSGIDIGRVNMLTFGIGALLTGFTGVLYAIMFPISPNTGLELTSFAFVIVVIGGVGSFSGTVIASLLIGLVDNFTAVFVGSRFRLFVIFLILLVVLVFNPTGLRGESV